MRNFIDIVEAKKVVNSTPWTISISDIFHPSLERHLKIFPDLRDKLKRFTETKLDNPLMNRYGKHDGPFTGPLAGFHHCHLRDDAILIYRLTDRKLHLVLIVSHSEIEGKRLKSTRNFLQPHR